MRQDSSSHRSSHWVAVWTAMPQLTEPDNLPAARPAKGIFEDTTLRQTLKLTLDSHTLRIRISNAFGLEKLHIKSMTVAQPGPTPSSSGSSLIDVDTLRNVMFGGKPGISIPNGALAVSDPVRLDVGAGESVTVSVYMEKSPGPGAVTGHPGSRTTSWLAPGDQTAARDLTHSPQPVDHWYFLSTVESWLPSDRSTFVIVGDSITDGRCSTTNGNDRWPDILSRRMQLDKYANRIAVVNQGAGGNRLLIDGLGPNAWSRITRDVLGQPGVKYAMIFEAVNDVGTAADTPEAQDAVYEEIISAYQQMIAQIRTNGIPVFGATLIPFSAKIQPTQPYSSMLRDRTRVKVNRWIKESGAFDYVVDFASTLANPHDPSELDLAYDSGDFLHPSVAGFNKMAEVFDIGVFERFEDGASRSL